MALLHVSFFSEVLGMCMQMDVILPERARGQIGMNGCLENGKIPTLYLMHGMSDDHTIWQRRTSIERYVSELGIAVVMPSTHLGWYTNTLYGSRYFTYFTEELPSICRNLFNNLSDKKEDTFVAGLSMGGYGAFKLALGAPQTFGMAASLSGALDLVRTTKREDLIEAKGLEYWTSIFGPLELVKDSEHDLLYLASQLKEAGEDIPKLYFWCGTEDFLYEGNLSMKEHLSKLGCEFTFEESAGDHQWKYWDEKIQRVLEWIMEERSK